MINNKKVLAIIPARSGSKRLPRKNILNLAGKPLIAWTIESAIRSKYIDSVLVSTDSPEIAEISKKFGAQVPFIRPEYLSNDTADTISVIKHAIDNIPDQYDIIVLLQATSPLRNTDDIDGAIEQSDSDFKAVVSVCPAEHPPLWSNILPDDLSMAGFIRPEIKNKRSQDLPTYYRLNGAVYVAELSYFMQQNGFMGPQTKAYIMDQKHSVDIDTEIDFRFCETLINQKNKT